MWYVYGVVDQGYFLFFGNKGVCVIYFCDWLYFMVFFRILIFIVFLFRRCWSFWICFRVVVSLEVGMIFFLVVMVVRLFFWYCFFYLNSRLGWILCRWVIWEIFMFGFIVCWIMVIFFWGVLCLWVFCFNRILVILKLVLVLDIYLSLFFIWRYSYCLVF